MDVAETLDKLRHDIGRCDLAVFVDLSTGSVLSSATGMPIPQEELDALSVVAQETLTGQLPESAEGVTGAAQAVQAVLMTSDAATVVQRASPDSAEALVCVCGADVGIENAMTHGRRALDRILAAG